MDWFWASTFLDRKQNKKEATVKNKKDRYIALVLGWVKVEAFSRNGRFVSDFSAGW